MRKKTAPHIQKNRAASSRKASGLIAQDLSAQQSATLDCVLDNRSHRTNGWRLSCGAEPECSQTECHDTASRTSSGFIGHGRRQLQARVRRQHN